MKINSTIGSGFGNRGMAGFGAGAWNVGSAPITIASRSNRNKKAVARKAREIRSEKNPVPALAA
ncbi:MAG: hypothetical protein GXY61_11595 [Lentisphaerae bacterium]|nr:hypothetical protein [Lentisphaerota bacterium]